MDRRGIEDKQPPDPEKFGAHWVRKYFRTNAWRLLERDAHLVSRDGISPLIGSEYLAHYAVILRMPRDGWLFDPPVPWE